MHELMIDTLQDRHMVEFFFVLRDDPYRTRVYDTKVCKAPERTNMWREMVEFCLRRDCVSYGWRIKDTLQERAKTKY